MHGNGTLPLVGIQCFGVTDLANKALEKEELRQLVVPDRRRLKHQLN
jgi:hypothetical protein